MDTKENKFGTFIKALLKQFLVIVLYVFLIITLQSFLIDYVLSSNGFIQGLSSLFIEMIVLLVFIIMNIKLLSKDLLDFKDNGKKYIKDNFKYYIIGLVIMMVSNIIISSFIGIATNEAGNRDNILGSPITSIINVILVATIIEELMVRVPLKDKIKPNFIYYLLSGLIFGGLHLIVATNIYELFYIIPYGTLGFVFAYIYQKTDNVCSCIFFHMLHNTLAIILIFLLGVLV